VLAFGFMAGSVNGTFAGAPAASSGSATTVEPVVGALVDTPGPKRAGTSAGLWVLAVWA